MPSKNLSFRTPQPLMDQIQSRDLKGVDNPGVVAKRDVERWYAVLGEAMSEVKLSPAESVVLIHLVDAFYDHPVTLSEVLMAHYTVGDGPMGLGEAFTAVRKSLAEKMAGWSIAAKYAAWDAAERYQVVVLRNLAREEQAEELTFGMALHRVGLHTYDLPPDELAAVERMGAVEASLLPSAYLRAVEEAAGG